MKSNLAPDVTDTKKHPKTGGLAGGSVVSGFLALLGASCCVLPIILVNLGVSSALVSYLGMFARARSLLMGLSIALIAAAFYFSCKGQRRPSRRTLIFLLLSLALVIGAYIFPHYESRILRWWHLR